MDRVKIFNDKIDIEISALGAEMKSMKYKGKELLWGGNPEVWSGQAPLLFPICGGLKDDCFIWKGKEYSLPKHGFARKTVFETESRSDSSAVFLLKANEETKKSYPFDFELRVKYAVKDNVIFVDYEVKNDGNDTMYFSIGAHEAYACPGGIENCSVEFEAEEELNSSQLDGNLLKYEAVKLPKKEKTLDLKNKYFETDALVFTDILSRSVTLKNNVSGEKIKVDFPDSPYLLLWTIPGAEYICIEPWNGIPDYVDSDRKIENKKGIIKLESGKTVTIGHKITFEM